MMIEQYWTVLVKQWRLILLCFLVVGAGAAITSRLMTRLYQSTALVQIAIHSISNQADYNSLLASDQLVQTEAKLAASDPVLREVASHYPGLTVEKLSQEVTTVPTLNTQLFEIDVVDPSPTRAAALANDIAKTLIQQQLQLFEQNNSASQQQIQGDLNATQQQISNITTQIAALQAKGGSQAQIVTLQTQLSALQQHYSLSQTALAQLELTEAQNDNNLLIAQPAQPNLTPVRPDILLNTGAGLLAGLFLGIMLAILFERLDTRVRNPETLSALLGWLVLATIWRASPKEDLISPTGRNANVEAYRILRSNIGFLAVDKPLRTLEVTSAMPRDGKSLTAANVAIFMAKAGKNTLLIDADLRRPALHEIFGLPADRLGLSNAVLAFSKPKISETLPLAISMPDMPGMPGEPYISSTNSSHRLHPATLQSAEALTTTSLSLEPFIHSVGVPNLWVMPTGPLPPNPSELLDSKAMQRIFTALASCGADVVIFDTPPLLGLSDASILASKVDGTIVVVDITRANKKILKQMKAQLEQAGAHILGCVVNKQRRGPHDSAYSYYYYADDQNARRNHNTGKKNSSAVPENIFKQPEMQNGEGGHRTQDVNFPKRQPS